jgi:seryl-tRNA synthetase
LPPGWPKIEARQNDTATELYQKSMLQIQILRDEKERVIKGLEKKNLAQASVLVENALRIDTERREVQLSLNQLQEELNRMSAGIGGLMKEGKKEEAETLRQKVAGIKVQVKELEEKSAGIEEALYQALIILPNVPHESVPPGKTPEENEVVETWGEAKDMPSWAQPHWDLIAKYDIIDFENGNKVTGAGFPFYKGKGAKLQRALINFFLDEAEKAGYYEMQPPILINKDSGYGTGQLPDKDGQMYHAQTDDLFLIPTAEVPITNYFRDTILKESELPKKCVGYTPCFRREAGSWGAHVRGLNRLHQFDKVEIVQIAHPDESYKILETMRKYVQGILEKLELPYRVLRLCGGDMSVTSALTYDMEVYSAAQKRWLEVSSVSNFETYQSNRLKLRTKSEETKKTYLLHTLNGSALALPRIVAALLENNQTETGIKIPAVLQKYTGFDKIGE